jgi:hypothetical protein
MKLFQALVGSLAASLALCVSVTYAGGWAVTTLDPLASELRAGDTYRIGYTIRQHGETPFVGAQTAIEIESANGVRQRFGAHADGPPGHYVAEVRFPDSGEWRWRVDQSPFAPQALGSVRVVGPPPPASPLALLPFLMLAIAVATLAFAWRLVVYQRSARRVAAQLS